MSQVGYCCIEIRSMDDGRTLAKLCNLSSQLFSDRIRLVADGLDLEFTSAIQALGGFHSLRFPSSSVLEAPLSGGTVEISRPLSATKYWVNVNPVNGHIAGVVFEVMIDVFCLMALEQEQLLSLGIFQRLF